MKNSYAQQASKIMSRYKLRLGENFDNDDPLAKKGLDMEMSALQAEQEADRTLIASAQPTHTMPDGTIMAGVTHQPQLQTGGGIPNDTLTSYNKNKNYNEFGQGLSTNQPVNEFTQYMIDNPYDGFTGQVLNEKIVNEAEPQNEYYNPALGGISATPLVASAVGNLLMRSQADKYSKDQVQYGRVSPSKINLGRERDAAQREASRARLSTGRQAKSLGLNAAAAAQLGVASQAGISRNLGERIGKSFTQEELTNAQSKQRADQINVNLGVRETDANRANKQYSQQLKDQAIQNIISDTGSFFSDVNKAKSYNQLYKSLPGTTSLYNDPNQSLFDRIVGGQRSTIKQDPSKYAPYTNI